MSAGIDALDAALAHLATDSSVLRMAENATEAPPLGDHVPDLFDDDFFKQKTAYEITR